MRLSPQELEGVGYFRKEHCDVAIVRERRLGSSCAASAGPTDRYRVEPTMLQI
jgi:hypothetical protein